MVNFQHYNSVNTELMMLFCLFSFFKLLLLLDLLLKIIYVRLSVWILVALCSCDLQVASMLQRDVYKLQNIFI